jgi:hypothetical protein
MIRTIPSVVATVFVALSLGCGGGSDDKQTPQSPPPPPTVTSTPDQLCQTLCQMMTAPACPKSPPDYATSCLSLCKAKYTQFPNCEAQLKAIDFCATTKESYSCSANGNIQVTPVGGCANEGAACMGCTQSMVGCF